MNQTKFPFLFIVVCSLLAACSNNPNSSSPNNTKLPNFKMLWRTDGIFKMPESVLYDEKRDVIYVSNVNENPGEKDQNGYISRISGDGVNFELTWVLGLSSPKGMGLFENTLYVADVDEIVAIDVELGKIIQNIPFSESGLLSDLVIDPSGKLYVTDTESGRIYLWNKAAIEIWKTGLNKPKGIFLEDNRLYITSAETGSFSYYDTNSKEEIILGDGLGNGNGIVKTPEGDFILSDMDGEIFIYRDNEIQSIYKPQTYNFQTADLGIIPDKRIILIPTYNDNKLMAFQLGN